MRKEIIINEDWLFRYHDGSEYNVNIPHTWNNEDGQDGGDDYYRGTCFYEKTFTAPALLEEERLYIEFNGVNASARVVLNGKEILSHDGGYSTFRTDITDYVKKINHMVVEVDNSKNDRVYPQKADFTFYGGIYRDVKLLVVNRHHFDLDFYGGRGLAVCPEIKGEDAAIWVRTWHNAEDGRVDITLRDAEGKVVGKGSDTDETIVIRKAHLWHGIEDPYLYTCDAVLSVDGTMITAKVTNDEASFFSKKLPQTIIFDASVSGNTDLNIGDEIGGCYLKGSIEGEYVCVVSLDVNSND